MRTHFLAVAIFVLLTPTTAVAADVIVPIAGSVGIFRTDVRIFNPSSTKDVTLNVRFLPVGNNDNSDRFDGRTPPVILTIPKRQEAVFNDVVASIFRTTGLGAIHFSSTSPILITCRIYAQTSAGTLGQGFNAPDADTVSTRGVLLQLRSDSSFRTNIGVVNLQGTVANVTWSLYDRNNTLVSKRLVAMPPYAVVGPTSITAGFFFDVTGADLSEAWVAFSSDTPLAVYASVVDNTTTDPTYFAAQTDPAAP